MDSPLRAPCLAPSQCDASVSGCHLIDITLFTWTHNVTLGGNTHTHGASARGAVHAIGQCGTQETRVDPEIRTLIITYL